MVAAVMRELHKRHPELEVHLSALVVKLLVEVELLRLEELLDRVLYAGETRHDVVDGRLEIHEGLRDHTIRVEIALVRANDVREGLLDRAIRTWRGELPLLLRERATSLQQLLGRPHVVSHLTKHRRSCHVTRIPARVSSSSALSASSSSCAAARFSFACLTSSCCCIVRAAPRAVVVPRPIVE